MANNNNNNDTNQLGKFKLFLREWGSYASLLAQIVGPTLVFFGLGVNGGLLKWVLYGGLLLPLLGLAWLRREYRAAKQRMEVEGKVQRPEWLWTLLTGGITHKSQELSGQELVMVLVPPGMEGEASRLREIYNHVGKPHEVDSHGGHQLQFHYITQRADNRIEEDEGTRSPGGKPRPLNLLAGELVDCAGVVLLDDSLWKERYPRTLEIVRQWSVTNSVRPVMAIRADAGTLIYSWSLFASVAGEDRGLNPRLLAQAINRGTDWWRQANTNRWLLLRLAFITFALFLLCIILSYVYWNRARTYQEQSNKLSKALASVGVEADKADIHRDRDKTLALLTTIDQQERLKAAQSMAYFRNNPTANKTVAFNQLLKANAAEMKTIIERGSGVTADSNVIVMMFAVSKEGGLLHAEEVAATRNKTEIEPFTFDPNSPETKGIVTCSVAKRAFVLWTGDSTDPSKTTNIQAWDLQGRPIGSYRPDNRLEFGNENWCSYAPKPGKYDDQRNQMLCVPAGVADNSGEVVGAICVSSVGRNFLTEDWVRYLVTRFGTSLSFRSWGTLTKG